MDQNPDPDLYYPTQKPSLSLPEIFRITILAGALLQSSACTEPSNKLAPPPTPGAATTNEAAIARLELPRLDQSSARDAPIGNSESSYGDNAAEHGLLTLEEVLAETSNAGLSVAYFADGKILWTKTWGVADIDTGVAPTERTLFQAASISKPVAVAAFIRASEEGYFGLDQPVNEVLHSWRLPDNDLTAAQPVTARLLLSHTAGTTVHGFPGYAVSDDIPTVPHLLSGTSPANTAAVFVDVLPGTIGRYSGGGTTIAQQMLIDTVGRPFPEILDEWVLEPIGMVDSRYEQPPTAERAQQAARAYPRSDRETSPWHIYPELAAAGLWTTPSDLARFGMEVHAALHGDRERSVSPAAAALMTTPVGVGNFALGFEIQDRGSEDEPAWYFAHSGGNWGFVSNLVVHRETGYGYAAMVSGASFDLILELQRRLAKIYDWDGDFGRRPRNWPPAE